MDEGERKEQEDGGGGKEGASGWVGEWLVGL